MNLLLGKGPYASQEISDHLLRCLLESMEQFLCMFDLWGLAVFGPYLGRITLLQEDFHPTAGFFLGPDLEAPILHLASIIADDAGDFF